MLIGLIIWNTQQILCKKYQKMLSCAHSTKCYYLTNLKMNHRHSMQLRFSLDLKLSMWKCYISYLLEWYFENFNACKLLKHSQSHPTKNTSSLSQTHLNKAFSSSKSKEFWRRNNARDWENLSTPKITVKLYFIALVNSLICLHQTDFKMHSPNHLLKSTKAGFMVQKQPTNPSWENLQDCMT